MKRPGEITRAEAATMLRTNKPKIIRLEKSGELHPRQDGGVWYHHEAEVKDLAKAWGIADGKVDAIDDAVDATILDRLENGDDGVTIAKEMRVSIHRVVAIVDARDRLRRLAAPTPAHPPKEAPVRRAPRTVAPSEFETILENALDEHEQELVKSDTGLREHLRTVAESMARRGGTYDDQAYSVTRALTAAIAARSNGSDVHAADATAPSRSMPFAGGGS